MEEQQEQSQEASYVASVPAESEGKQAGTTEGVIAIICAVIALGFFPPIFGVAGIVLGVRARKKGAESLGLVAIILSAVFMVIGGLLGAGVAIFNEMSAGAAGFLLPL